MDRLARDAQRVYGGPSGYGGGEQQHSHRRYSTVRDPAHFNDPRLRRSLAPSPPPAARNIFGFGGGGRRRSSHHHRAARSPSPRRDRGEADRARFHQGQLNLYREDNRAAGERYLEESSRHRSVARDPYGSRNDDGFRRRYHEGELNRHRESNRRAATEGGDARDLLREDVMRRYGRIGERY
ncbi:hypothetical protein B0A48_05076 [Cryoendolithus antarcticus]|uniref:Uncharacterized protein n=1 Tax=Cryoendolithus antarcticus TaxID=1507870 RepID=A0A1V8TEH7_9PEZI|nr:hypothetical protein B0A48_05076 [Cryoendolithus antarcticus]